MPAALLERTAMERRRARGQRARRPVRLRQLLVRLQLLDERQLADAVVERAPQWLFSSPVSSQFCVRVDLLS